MSHDRRSVLAAIGLVLPWSIPARAIAAPPTGQPPVLRLRSFEDAVREAFVAFVTRQYQTLRAPKMPREVWPPLGEAIFGVA